MYTAKSYYYTQTNSGTFKVEDKLNIESSVDVTGRG